MPRYLRNCGGVLREINFSALRKIYWHRLLLTLRSFVKRVCHPKQVVGSAAINKFFHILSMSFPQKRHRESRPHKSFSNGREKKWDCHDRIAFALNFSNTEFIISVMPRWIHFLGKYTLESNLGPDLHMNLISSQICGDDPKYKSLHFRVLIILTNLVHLMLKRLPHASIEGMASYGKKWKRSRIILRRKFYKTR